MFAGCKKEDNITVIGNNINIADNIIGKWMKADVDGQPAPTNEKVVCTFVSLTKAYRSGSIDLHPEVGGMWDDKFEMSVAIDGNVINLTGAEGNVTIKIVYTVSSINATELIADVKVNKIVDGNIVLTIEEKNARLVKITQDYSQAIHGVWEGHVTSEQSEYDDNLEHRWQYNYDSTYVYYNQDGDNWIPNPTNTLNEYFVDGNLLCMRWINNGTEYREWWEIASIENNVMSWTALRKRDDGTTYTASFSMVKVVTEDYVDLGLPSGTLWKTYNELNPADPEYNFYTYDEAVAAFGDNLPTAIQQNELIEMCQWTYDNDNNVAIVTGPNGNTLVLPRLGKRSCSGTLYVPSTNGCYWSSTAINNEFAWRLDIITMDVIMYDGNRCAGASVRLVR